MPRLSSHASPFDTLRRQSTINSGSTSRDTIPQAPRRNNSSVSSSFGSGVTTTSRNPGFCRSRSETASSGFGASAASNNIKSAENFLAAEKVCDSVSAWPTTRTSSSTANILRSPARKIACVSATITRMNWPPSPSSGCPPFSNACIGLLAIQFPRRLVAVKSILINHHAHSVASRLFKIPYHSAFTIQPHIRLCAHNVRRQRDGEVHRRSHRHLRIHYLKQNSVG